MYLQWKCTKRTSVPRDHLWHIFLVPPAPGPGVVHRAVEEVLLCLCGRRQVWVGVAQHRVAGGGHAGGCEQLVGV